jgi:hypothetical protein
LDGEGDKSFFQAPQQDHSPGETRAPTLQSRTAEVLKGNIPAIYDEAFVIGRPTAPSMTVIAHVVPLLGKAGWALA